MKKMNYYLKYKIKPTKPLTADIFFELHEENKITIRHEKLNLKKTTFKEILNKYLKEINYKATHFIENENLYILKKI